MSNCWKLPEFGEEMDNVPNFQAVSEAVRLQREPKKPQKGNAWTFHRSRFSRSRFFLFFFALSLPFVGKLVHNILVLMLHVKRELLSK